MSDDPTNAGPAIADQTPAAAGNQPEELANLQDAIDAVKAQVPVTPKDEFKEVFGEPAAGVDLLPQKEDPEKVFVQTVKDAVRKLEASQSVTS